MRPSRPALAGATTPLRQRAPLAGAQAHVGDLQAAENEGGGDSWGDDDLPALPRASILRGDRLTREQGRCLSCRTIFRFYTLLYTKTYPSQHAVAEKVTLNSSSAIVATTRRQPSCW